MSQYARNTSTSIERSKGEIERTLRRYGADNIVTGMSAAQGLAFVAFHYRRLPLRIRIPLPPADDERFSRSVGGKRKRTPDRARTEWEKACRQQWRVLLLLIKGNLEAVENGVMAAEEVFLPWLVLGGRVTVFDNVREGIADALQSGQLKALPFGRGG